MTSHVSKCSQKRPQVYAKKVMTSSFMMSYFRKIFLFAIIAVIDKGKFFTQILAMHYTNDLVL